MKRQRCDAFWRRRHPRDVKWSRGGPRPRPQKNPRRPARDRLAHLIGKPVIVVWEDAASVASAGWESPGIHEPFLVTNVGWFTHACVKTITLHAGANEQKNGTLFCDRFQIPRTLVRRVEPLLRRWPKDKVRRR